MVVGLGYCGGETSISYEFGKEFEIWYQGVVVSKALLTSVAKSSVPTNSYYCHMSLAKLLVVSPGMFSLDQ